MNSKIDIIIDRLSWFKNKVELKGKLYLFDPHKQAENFFRDLLKLMYEIDNLEIGKWDLSDLENTNYKNPNAKAIDLYSDKAKLAIQVTTDNSKEKIDHTINGFFDKKTGYKERFNRLILLIFGEKNSNAKNHEKEYSEKYSDIFYDFKFDIWDIHTLTKEIDNYHIDKQEQILAYLEKWISPLMQKERRKESNEVETFIRLIEFLSNENLEADIKSEIDPNKKMERFADYQENLKIEYIDLVSLYGQSLTISEQQIGIDSLKAKKLAIYLKRISDNELTNSNGNPKIALNNLTEYFEQKINTQNFSYDANAIRFYLIDQLIKCNVFPNKV